MNVDGYNNESIERSKSVTGCFAMFLLFMSIMFLPAFYDGSKELLDKGYLYPLLFSLEFMTIVPLYYVYFRKREGCGWGNLRLGIFLPLFVCILFLQFVLPSLTFTKQPENWSVSQLALEGKVFWLNTVMMILMVPVYEEMIFRGCLLSVFKYWCGNNVYVAGIVVSIIFSACHLQYLDWRSFVILFLVSCAFVVGRVKSGGILTSVILHMLMNMVVISMPFVTAYLVAN
ncbi:CPBP family intramembrane glutamic endopeptidase [Enterobacter asburiae]|uniref:CPBP family intramembrane glutamic endopeptidase n=1 Tax=Enterobacter asburiae TaxID=61645 RepID=UPI000BB9B931|nr:type II CAAX endopeptidase family protein [Enterobacter asburiae]MDE4035126.1 type II CAAX endopeptidase family protein [Enterobacter asburiae]MDE4066036.1 type II CAAX endopeptidase family protein [Enterobacter asburiae]MDE4070152.1 type II CAAX endopeptidase family protein [Enterobacter asburiae]